VLRRRRENRLPVLLDEKVLDLALRPLARILPWITRSIALAASEFDCASVVLQTGHMTSFSS